eukprot:TRINITY_DN6984_c0_g1_i4.p1 TRINITY_DN6984_c0_g1~~TRINITY_DN6984_c0_g1_i4.p1  ORF type:complete len:516 (+),score=93.45 TRINITY_DN6984_c0_g1_i4:42-1589(+)
MPATPAWLHRQRPLFTLGFTTALATLVWLYVWRASSPTMPHSRELLHHNRALSRLDGASPNNGKPSYSLPDADLPRTPVFAVLHTNNRTRRDLLEIVGSLHRQHPYAPLFLLTAPHSANANLTATIHSLSWVNHLSSLTLNLAYVGLGEELFPLLITHVAVSRKGYALYLSEGHFLTSPVEDLIHRLSHLGYVSRVMESHPEAYIFGYTYKHPIYEKVEGILSSCRTICTETQASELREIYNQIRAKSTEFLVLPISQLDSVQYFYADEIAPRDLTSDAQEIKIGGLSGDGLNNTKTTLDPATATQSRSQSRTKTAAPEKTMSQSPVQPVVEDKLLMNRTKIAFLVPTTSKGSKNVNDLPIFEALLYTMTTTMSEQESLRFDYNIYLGYDEGDPMYDNSTTMPYFLSRATQIITNYPITLKIFKLSGLTGAPCWIWNELFRLAYEDGAEYFFQINDDVKLIKKGWLTNYVETLKTNPFLPNFGVVGPMDVINPKTMTQSFVHRTHYEVGMFHVSI